MVSRKERKGYAKTWRPLHVLSLQSLRDEKMLNKVIPLNGASQPKLHSISTAGLLLPYRNIKKQAIVMEQK
jgi:hypothetical protein